MLTILGSVIFVAVYFLQGDATAGATGEPLPGVVPIVEGIGAATLTGYLVGFFKKARPTASDGAIVAVAIAAGLFAALVISMVNGGIQVSQLGIGTIVLQGIGAAAISAGVQGANKPSVDSAKGL